MNKPNLQGLKSLLTRSQAIAPYGFNMRHSHVRKSSSSLTGTINRYVGMFVCLILAALCGYQLYQNDAYSRALETSGQSVVGTVIAQTLRPCMLGDICYRRRAPNLTHVGHATITYRDNFGVQHQGQHAINNKTAPQHRRGQRVSVTYPRGDAANASFGDPAYNQRKRKLWWMFYAIGLLVFLGGTFWLSLMPNNEFADAT